MSSDKCTPSALLCFKRYRRKGYIDCRPWQPSDDMLGISVSAEDAENGSPRPGDMIGRDPNHPRDRWLIAFAYFARHYEDAE